MARRSRVKKEMSEKEQSQKTIVGRIHPDVLSFTVGKDPVLDLDLAVWDCLGTAAHVTMLSRMRVAPRIFSTEERNRVVAALADIVREARAGAFAITEADQDVHLAVERRLTERLGDLGRRVHTGRSRNDQVAVDIRLHAKEQLLGLAEEAAALAEGLAAFGRRHAKVPMVGRTHLQPAMPSTVGLWAAGYAELLLDDLPLVEAAYITNDRCPLGSAAGYGVPLPLDRGLTARLLGFARPHHNVFHASNARGKNEAVMLAACGQVMLSLSRLAEDLILFSMPEFGYFVLPPEFCTGSSIMPQKYNPDVLELIRAKAAAVLGYGTAANTILKALPGGYNRDLQETKELYMEGLRVTRASLRIMALLVKALKVRPERLRAGFGPGVFATDRALELVAGGMPFRDAYQHVRSHLDELEAADPDAAVAAKTHEGGTAGLDFGFYRSRAGEVRRWARERRRHAHAAYGRLLGAAWGSGSKQ
jgi:argininosuccinate lyase